MLVHRKSGQELDTTKCFVKQTQNRESVNALNYAVFNDMVVELFRVYIAVIK